MQIRNLLIFCLFTSAITARAEEIALPDILNKQPEKSLSSNQDPARISSGNSSDEKSSRPVIFNSMLFSQQNAPSLENAHAMYTQILKTMSLNEVQENKQVADKLAAPALPPFPIKSVYLSSIIYNSKKDAMAWINSDKFKLGDKVKDITFVSATHDKATVKIDLGQYSFNYDDKEIAENPLIIADKDKKELRFTLTQNHRLDLDNMKFFAGKSYNAPKPPVSKPVVLPGTGNVVLNNLQRPTSIELPTVLNPNQPQGQANPVPQNKVIQPPSNPASTPNQLQQKPVVAQPTTAMPPSAAPVQNQPASQPNNNIPPPASPLAPSNKVAVPPTNGQPVKLNQL